MGTGGAQPSRTGDTAPPAFFSLVGHPLRWQLLAELCESDRTVHELTLKVDEAQNLVSYHLGKLRSAGLVTTRRSSADGRDAYYAADLARLGQQMAASAVTLHPGLLASVGAALESSQERPAEILFLCTGNSARSQIAAALTTELSGGAVQACSAGSHPKTLHPNAVRVLHDEYGIDIAGAQTTHMEAFSEESFDWVITLCDRVREVCPEFPGAPTAVHWSIPDPAAADGDDNDSYPEFRRVAAEIETRVGFLLAVVALRPPNPVTPKEER